MRSYVVEGTLWQALLSYAGALDDRSCIAAMHAEIIHQRGTYAVLGTYPAVDGAGNDSSAS